MFAVNDKVVCVDGKAPATSIQSHLFDLINGPPIEGRIYCVAGMDEREFIQGVFPRVFLTGMGQVCRLNNMDYGFNPARFRKVSEVQAENRVKRAARKEASHE
jgi:hypothetical protein